MTEDDASAEVQPVSVNDEKPVGDSNLADVISEKNEVSDSNGDDKDASTKLSSEDKELLRDLTKVKTSSEKSKIKREREAHLRMLDLDPNVVMKDYSRLCGMGIDPSFALVSSDPMERIQRMELWVSERRKAMPRAGSAPLLKEKENGPTSINSARAVDAYDDVEEVARLIFLSRTITSRLEVMVSEQRALESELLDRLTVLQGREEKIVSNPPSWILEISRVIEATGLQAANFRGHRREMVDAVIEAVVKVASNLPDDVNKTLETDGIFDRVTTRMRDHADSVDALFAGQLPDVDGQPVPPALGNDDDDDIDFSAQQSAGPLAPAIDEKALGFFESGELCQRADGHGLITSIDNVDTAYAGFASQYIDTMQVLATYNKELGDVFARLDERVPFPAGQFSVGLDGEIDPLCWAKFEVPAGPYKLIQVKGQSSLLPRYTQFGMLPPVASLEDAGNLLGMIGEPGVQSSLKAWGPAGDGPAHTRPHVLDGSQGDPAEAIEVCRKLVAMQRVRWKDAEHVTDIAMESIARWWLFLLAGRMRPGQIDLLWPDGFFHGVEGHDPLVTENAHYRLVRCDGGRIGAALKAD